MSTEENEKKESRPRKIAKSASTAERPAFKPGEAVDAANPDAVAASVGDAPAHGVKSERKWDLRAERPAGGPASRPRPPRRQFGGDPQMPMRRPGASGGRAMPELPNRDRVADRASPEFVDRWLSQKPRPRPEPGAAPPRGDRPFGDRPGRDRRPPRDGAPPARDGRPGAAAAARPPRPVPEAKKLPTLSETLLVGLPKVAVEGMRDKSANKPKTAKEALLAKAAQQPAKPAPEKAAPKAKIELKKEWISAGAEQAKAVLAEAGEAGEKLVEAWTQANNAAAIVEAASDESVASGPRKAAKRSINILRARNVAIPERASAKVVSAGEEEIIEATFTPPDARGTTSFTIARRRGGDRAHIAEVIVRDEVGIVHAVSGYMSRSQIKEAHQRVADSAGMPPINVPVEWVRARIAEAKRVNATSEVLLPLGLDKCKELIEPQSATPIEHPIAGLEKTLGDEASSTGSGALHSEPEFRGWLPDARALDELLRKVGSGLTPEEAKEPGKVDAILKEELKAATDRFFTPELRAVVARRLRDAAIGVRQRLGDDKAKEVVNVARSVERAGLITSPPHEVEFLLAFFQKGVAVLAQQSGGQLRVPVAQP